jgi:hypothetical protein
MPAAAINQNISPIHDAAINHTATEPENDHLVATSMKVDVMSAPRKPCPAENSASGTAQPRSIDFMSR